MTTGPRDTITLRSRVPARAAGTVLVDWLTGRFPYHTSAEWRGHIASGAVRVDGRRVAPDHPLRSGAVVAYEKHHVEPPAPTDAQVVHDHGGVLVVDKPAGLPVHADGAFLTRTLVALLSARLGAGVRPVQRLDRETSGLCLFARDRRTARQLREQLEQERIEKVYESIVRGVLDEDRLSIDRPLARDPHSVISIRRAVVAPDAAGAQPARTSVEVLARGPAATHVRCLLHTGRTHQIRAHLAALGHPVVGDKLYGRSDEDYLAWVKHVKAGGDPAWDDRLGAPRQMLHARRLAFRDPRTGERMPFEAGLPADFRACLAREGLD